jgi:hypothetical protein
MTARRIVLAVVTAFAVGVAAPGAASAATVVGAQGGGERAYVLKGQTLLVKLRPADSRSTGYHWQSRHKETGVLRLLRSRTSGNAQVFSYRARRAGNAHLRFRYLPPGSRRAARRDSLDVGVNNRWRATTCHPQGARTVVENTNVRVFKLRRKVYTGIGTKPWAFSGHFGCVFEQNRSFGFDGAASNNPDRSIPASGRRYYLPTLRGTLFGHACVDRGSEFRPATEITYVARTIDLGERRVIRAALPDLGGPGSNNPILDLVMSDSGGLAWIEDAREGRVVARSDAPPAQENRPASDRTVLDDGQSGAVDSNSLELDGSDVTWLRAGQQQRAPLR